jgi:hydrogenase maturation protein HypF
MRSASEDRGRAEGVRIEVRGTVQGVGFRPWVYRIAREVGVGGRVRNHPLGVTVEAFGDGGQLAELVARLRDHAPLPARVRAVTTEAIPAEVVDDFVIDRSAVDGLRALSIPPDLPTCPDCEREIFDPDDRRHGYAFTNCTRCGPRFTIATGIPYDRAATTMLGFAMCPRCQREYGSVDDRRFHAQPNACPECGPELALWTADGAPIREAPLAGAAARLRYGAIVAVKGLGGFHLACDATQPASVSLLRTRKRRDHKPFAVMVRDLAAAHDAAELTDDDVALLTGPERPIVLVPRRIGAPIAPEVAPESDLLGLLLPYTPLHHLLAAAVDRPLVMTSANVSDEPICCDEADAVLRLRGVADALLVHDRPIANRCDDSVARVIAGRPTLLRRSRGWVPRPIVLPRAVSRPILGCGAHLKNTFCIAVGTTAYLGPHVGDLENLATLDFLEAAIAQMEVLLRVRPDVVAHDLHPAYLSSRYAEARPAAARIAAQHHHAHVVSAMTEHGLDGPVLGVAYDGTGWGTDGTAWGGELLVARRGSFERAATFRPIALAGGDVAIREPWRIALALVVDAFDGDPPDHAVALLAAVDAAEVTAVRRVLAGGAGVARARGIGRYFDGVAALALRRARSRHDGQLAVAWNAVAEPSERRPYPWRVDDGADVLEIDLRPLVRAVVADLCGGVPAAIVSARFHETIVAATADTVRAQLAARGPMPVVLTGGVFQNPRLVEGLIAALDGVDLRRHGEVPPGDGGIALGQVVIADAILGGA